MGKVTLNGEDTEYDSLLGRMDEELMGSLRTSREWPSDQDFLDAYSEAHLKQFGERFQIGE